MDLFDILLVLTLLFVSFLYFSKNRKERRRIVDAVEKFGGASWYPILGTVWSQVLTPKEELFQQMYDRPKQYGPLFRSWVGSKPLIHITKAEHAEIVLKSNTNISKGDNMKFIRPWLGNGLISSEGQHWQRHRKLITPTFHFKILDSFQEIFSEKGQMLAEELKPLADGEYHDLSNHITHTALDIICETAMGVEINAMKCYDSPYIKALYRMMQLIIHRWFRAWLHPDPIYNLTAVGKEQKEILSTIHQFAEKVIKDRKKIIENSSGVEELSEEDKLMGKKRRLAFLDLLLQHNMEHNEMTDQEIREEVDTFMFAGHDTTTASTCWTLFSIGNYPEVQERIHHELDSIFHGEERPILPEDVAKMSYLERVLKESIRVHTIIPYILRLITEDIELDGKLVPAGVSVAIHITNMHGDPDQFPDPKRFDPDRFLPENIAKRNPYAFIPFSAGPRNCLGQKFAIRNTKTMLASILRKYKIKSLHKPSEIKYYGDITLRPQQGMFIALEPRTL